MNITIDGRVIEIIPSDKNIVDVANRVEIAIPDACYRVEKSKGCCQACIVEIDGELKYACATVPTEGMNVVVGREDLKATRKQRLFVYQENVKNGTSSGCSCSDASDCSE
ncbi:MAG: (2Fe-2S)-binding protein [Phycisphaeraceae bacterium]|nr:(2Fe-2S)-binding protein [Phycisphaeraceae bacterium]